jgi:hypothetical protein
MRRMLLGAIAVLVLGACHGGGGRATTVYVNEKNETLTMEYQPAVYNHLYNVTHQDMKLYQGSYTLKTSEGTTSGTYTRSVRGKKASLVFNPKEGKPWGAEMGANGSFTNERGVWTQRMTRVEEKAPALVRLGG